jgi:hypothetical protein
MNVTKENRRSNAASPKKQPKAKKISGKSEEFKDEGDKRNNNLGGKANVCI